MTWHINGEWGEWRFGPVRTTPARWRCVPASRTRHRRSSRRNEAPGRADGVEPDHTGVVRGVWSVVAVLIVGGLAAVGAGVGLSPAVPRLPGPVTVRANTYNPHAAGRPTRGAAGLPMRRHKAEIPERPEPVSIVAPERPVSSLPPRVGSDTREAEQRSPGPSSRLRPGPAREGPVCPRSSRPGGRGHERERCVNPGQVRAGRREGT
jgi:hypothetical protein